MVPTAKMHHTFMLQGLELAKTRQGFTCPNPPVGAVLVKDHKIIAQGVHYAAGHPHAEVEVLSGFHPDELKDTTLYVTLEPCSHYGKTPPCTELIIAKGIKKVYYGYADPNPDVSGLGATRLEKAGISCELLTCHPLQEFYKYYHYWCTHKIPYVTGKLAITLDEIIADAKGHPFAITGKEATEKTHQMRKIADAILSTAKTILMDNPQLNVRIGNETWPKPLFILDSRAQLTGTERIFDIHNKIFLLHSHPYQVQWDPTKVTCLSLTPNSQGYIPIKLILQAIGKIGYHHLWVEAGGELLTSFFKAGYMNQFFLYIAPFLYGNGQKAFKDRTIFNEWINNCSAISWSALGRDGLLSAIL